MGRVTIVADFLTGFACCYCSARFRSSAEYVIPEQFSEDPRLERRLLCWSCAGHSLAAEKIAEPSIGRPRWAGRGLQVLDRSRLPGSRPAPGPTRSIVPARRRARRPGCGPTSARAWPRAWGTMRPGRWSTSSGTGGRAREQEGAARRARQVCSKTCGQARRSRQVCPKTRGQARRSRQVRAEVGPAQEAGSCREARPDQEGAEQEAGSREEAGPAQEEGSRREARPAQEGPSQEAGSRQEAGAAEEEGARQEARPAQEGPPQEEGPRQEGPQAQAAAAAAARRREVAAGRGRHAGPPARPAGLDRGDPGRARHGGPDLHQPGRHRRR